MKYNRLWLVLTLIGVALGAGAVRVPKALAADAVVGSGTPASCDETAFDAALATVQAAPPGTITFNCGPALHTIDIYNSATITTDVTVDGGGQIRLFAQGASPTFTKQRFFEVSGGGTLTLKSIILEGARGPAGDGWGSQGGSIVVWGASYLDLQDSTILNSASTAWGGAIANEGGAVRVQNSLISGTAKWGGAYNGADGFDVFINATVTNSLSAEGGGGLRFWNSQGSTITDSVISDNVTSGGGGGIENLGGYITITGSYVENNTAVLAGGGIRNRANGASPAIMIMGTSRIAANHSDDNGGGIDNDDTLTLVDTLVDGNAAVWGGGLLNWGGQLSLYTATISRNTADQGAGLYSHGGGATIKDSRFLDNQAMTEGGGLLLTEIAGADSTNWVNITGSDISGNWAAQTGGGLLARRAYVTVADTVINDNGVWGVYLWQTTTGGSYVTMTRSSVYDNDGGGIYVGAQSTFLAGNTTISENDGWGVWGGQDSIYASLTFTTVRGNLGGQLRRTGGRLALEATVMDRGTTSTANCFTDAGLPALEGTGSWSSDTSCGAGVTAHANVDLGPLELNGGRTPTHLPDEDSPLIDQVSCAGTPVDQRGISRPQGDACDVGAVEVSTGSPVYRSFVPMISRQG